MDKADEEAQTLSRYGRAREKYLMEHRKGLYNSMLLTGRLWKHLTEIDQAAQAQVDALMAEMAKNQGVNEALKAANQMDWVQRMNNIKQAAEEIVLNDLIYS
ncbi:TnpV protein [Blautia schinkii]|nr:TnpV protein [Blautia schinkii]